MFLENPFAGAGVLFTIVPLIIAVGVAFVIGSLLVQAAQRAAQWHDDNQQPSKPCPPP